MTIVVFANTVCMAFDSYHMNESLMNKLEIANTIFVVIYNIELVIKLLGLGKQYFHHNWFIFEMILVILSDLG